MYTGIIFDMVSEVILERSPVERLTEDEAYEDALKLALQLGYDEADCYIYDEEMKAVCFD